MLDFANRPPYGSNPLFPDTMPFPIVRPNPLYRSTNAAFVRPFGTGTGTGSSMTSPRASAIGRSSSSTEPVQMGHAASAYEMNWMNATDDGGGSIGPAGTSFAPPVLSLSHEEIEQREGLFPSAPRRRRGKSSALRGQSDT